MSDQAAGFSIEVIQGKVVSQGKDRILATAGGNNLHNFEDVRPENGSSQGQNLAVTGLCVPSWLDSGPAMQGLGLRA